MSRKLKVDKIVLYHVGEHGMDAESVIDLLSGHTCEDYPIVTGNELPTDGLHICEEYQEAVNSEDLDWIWGHDKTCLTCGGKGYYVKE